MVCLCSECGYDWASQPRQTVATIQVLPSRLTTALRSFGIDNDSNELRRRPAADVWSPLEYIAHSGAAIGWYADRVTRVLTEQRPVFEAFDWGAHTACQRYHEQTLDDVLSGVDVACARSAAMLSGLNAADWQREGSGSDGQPRSIEQLASRAAHEAHHHLHDIRSQLSGDTSRT